MLKTKVGYSENVDAFESGVETAKMANVVENPQVGLFFTSCVQDQQKLMEGAKSVLGDTPIIGCTSSAALCTQDGYLNKETGYSGMMLFGGDCEVVSAGSEKTEESPREIGARVAKEALAKRKGVNNNIAESEIQMSYYAYTITIDLDRVGIDGDIQILDSAEGLNPFTIIDALDLNGDSKMDVIVANEVMDVPRFDICYQVYGMKGNKFSLIKSCK